MWLWSRDALLRKIFDGTVINEDGKVSTQQVWLPMLDYKSNVHHLLVICGVFILTENDPKDITRGISFNHKRLCQIRQCEHKGGGEHILEVMESQGWFRGLSKITLFEHISEGYKKQAETANKLSVISYKTQKPHGGRKEFSEEARW